MGSRKLAHISPGRTIIIAFIFTILAGTLTLALPIAQIKTMPFIDLFFTATSATCVTGLFTLPLSNFSFFGQATILALIQIGGLGLITLTIFFVSLFADIGLASQLMAGQLLEMNSWQNIKKTIFFIVLTTLSIEFLGALCIYPTMQSISMENAWFLSVFHAVSSFCSAGISLFKNNMEFFSQSMWLLTVTALLMLAGGLGFITWYEIMQYALSLKKKKRHSFSLHSRIILSGSAILITITTVGIFLLEHQTLFSNMGFLDSIANAFFHAISFRSTGFLTFNVHDFQLATLMLMMIISFIGSSSGSTGSGIKITTLAIFLSTIKAAIIGRTSIEIKGRKIPKDQVFKAIAIVAISAGWIMACTFCLLLTEKSWQFIDYLIESISAFTTLGVSTGLTPALSPLGKLFITASMIFGRIGSFTLILALKFKKQREHTGISYPEERIMLG